MLLTLFEIVVRVISGMHIVFQHQSYTSVPRFFPTHKLPPRMCLGCVAMFPGGQFRGHLE